MLGFNAPASSAIADERFYRFTASVSGVSANAAVAAVSVSGGGIAQTTGVTGTTSLGTAIPVVSESVSVLGVSTILELGSVLVYGEIIPEPGTTWTDVDDDNDTSWTEITDSSGSWTEVVT